MPTKSRTALIAVIWGYVQKEEEVVPADLKTTEKEIEEAVIEIDGEIRISGETGNTFSDWYVNYYDAADIAAELLHYLAEKGFESDWYNPGYMIVEGK